MFTVNNSDIVLQAHMDSGQVCSEQGLGPHGHVPDHGVYAVDVWLQKPLHVAQSSY